MRTNPLIRIAEAYKKMPNGGAILTCHSNGAISNGFAIIHTFKNSWRAFHALKDAGFVRQNEGWKLQRRERIEPISETVRCKWESMNFHNK